MPARLVIWQIVSVSVIIKGNCSLYCLNPAVCPRDSGISDKTHRSRGQVTGRGVPLQFRHGSPHLVSTFEILELKNNAANQTK